MRYFALLSTALSFAAASPIAYPPEQTCNGKVGLCDRRYSNISFIGAHDSPFVGSTIDPTTNQGVDVTAQLNAGIRFLQGQTHKSDDGVLHFCHTYCQLQDAGPVKDYLSKVKKWMDANPNEVVTMLLVNGDFDGVGKFDDAFKTANLDKYAYAPDTVHTLDDWPTLGKMIENNNRLVVFMDSKADRSKVPYILSEFDNYFFETPYDTTDKDFNQCSLDRPSDGNPDRRMYIVNHFLDKDFLPGIDIQIPDNDLNFRTNAASGAGSIGAQAELCTNKYGRKPNFILVDRFDRGEVFKAQHALNFP